MRNQLAFWLTFGVVLVVAPAARAEDDKPSKGANVSGEVEVGGIGSGGVHDSAKAEEYQDLSSGVTSDVSVKYDDKKKGDYGVASGSNFGRDDQEAAATVGSYGTYKLDLSYSEIPHRYTYGSETIYSGIGSDELTVNESTKESLSSATSPTDLANRLNEAAAKDNEELNLGVQRKTAKLKFQYSAWQPVTLQADLSSENREGTRPMMGSFGFGNVVEVMEPIDYNTTQLRFSADYNSKFFYLSTGYFFSGFQNDTGSMSYDNPFRTTDSTAPGAYIGPRFVNGTYFNNGPARSLVTLPADNLAHGPSLTAAIRNLPWHSQLTMGSSFQFMEQNNSFDPYTSNTAIIGSNGFNTFNASTDAGLPADKTDLSATTSSYNVGLTSRPITWLDATAKYRYFNYDNTSDQITFPGYVVADSSWTQESVTTNPLSYSKQTAGADVGARVEAHTRLGVFDKYTDIHRDNDAVTDQSENTVGTSVDNQFNEMVTTRTSYEKSKVYVGDYDITKPNLGEDMPSQLPMLRKYYEASRDTDAIRFITTATPSEALTVSGGFLYGNSNYDQSAFGLLDDRNYQFSADADYTVTSWLSVKPSYSYEHHRGNQAARQWSSGSFGDPYLVDTGRFSVNNWSAETVDEVNTLGAGATVTIIPKSLFFDLNYAYVVADGEVNFDSPLGPPTSDSNSFIPGDFGQVDNSRGHRVNPALRYKVTKDGTLSLGYLWEKYTFNDYQNIGFTSVPLTPSGNPNGAILGGSYLLDDYEINVVYMSFRYRFS